MSAAGARSQKNGTASVPEPQSPPDGLGGWLIHAGLLFILIVLYLCSLIDLSDMNILDAINHGRECRGQASKLAVFADESEEPPGNRMESRFGIQTRILLPESVREGAIQPGGWIMENAAYE